MFPSLKTLKGYGFANAEEIRQIYKKTWNPIERNPRATLRAIKEKLPDFENVEEIRTRKGTIIFINTGDTYGTTILFYKTRFWVGDWGSIVERDGSI